MANFDLLKFSSIEESELDTAITSSSANGTEKRRLRFTKIRKTFTCTPTLATEAEKDELKVLFDTVRTVISFVWDHPTEEVSPGVPKQYTVRFKENIKITKMGSKNGFYQIAPFTLDEV